MTRPPDLFDREHEWRELASFAADPGVGARLGLVRGRRRQGKSYLLRRLAAATSGLYHQAVQGSLRSTLADFGSTLGRFLDVPGGHLAFDSWSSAIDTLFDLGRGTEPTLVILDEFPYLLAEAPELPSLLQRAIDRSRDGGRPIRLILCGSALSAMAGLLTGSQALRGRASLDLIVDAFDFRTAAEYWGISDPQLAFPLHAIVGGTPGYRDLAPSVSLQRASDLPGWLAAGPLSPSSALFREDEHLLGEEATLVDRSLYHAVLAAIADGKSTQGSIATALGRDQRALQHPLSALVETGFVVRTDDALRDRRPIYRIADPIIRFHHVVTRRDVARFEDRRTEAAWTDARPRFASHVLGPHFEQLARDFTFRFASSATIGGTPSVVAPAVLNDSRARAQHEVDVVALERTDNGSSRVVALGEAKHTLARRTIGDLDRLDHIRRLVVGREPSAGDARLLLFSAHGFERRLERAAQQRGDVELIDLARLYRGD